jgi:hypothetical protein
MANIIDNANPKKNPVTGITGGVFIVLGAVMYTVKYLFPLFITLKQEVHYSDWIPGVMIFIGLTLTFMSDLLFERIFNAFLAVFKSKTNT